MANLANPNRRVPPPCWTNEETLALVMAYRDRWFSSNRGNLRSSDWESIAQSLSFPSPPYAASGKPPKSALQCRHKVEKLRRRYRDEKRRLLENPRRFSSSSWDLFPLLDSMEIGSFGVPGPEPKLASVEDSKANSGTGFGRKLESRENLVPVSYGNVSRLVNSGVGFASRAVVRNRVEMGPVEELAAAIRMSVERYLKVEEMKMDAFVELERMKMERELQRSRMMLEFQEKFVDSFVKEMSGFGETEKKRKWKKFDRHGTRIFRLKGPIIK